MDYFDLASPTLSIVESHRNGGNNAGLRRLPPLYPHKMQHGTICTLHLLVVRRWSGLLSACTNAAARLPARAYPYPFDLSVWVCLLNSNATLPTASNVVRS